MGLSIQEAIQSEPYRFLKNERRLGGNIMFLTFGGSRAYGTDGPQSDIDIRGISAPLREDILGAGFLRSPLDADNRHLVFGPAGYEQYNDTATDTIIYGLDKGLSLLCQCNPNMVEILGCLPEHYTHVTDAGRMLLDSRALFLSRAVEKTFGGYARNQFYRLKNAIARDSTTLAEKQFYMRDVIGRMYRHLEQAYPTFRRDSIRFVVTDKAGNPLTIQGAFVSLDDVAFTYKGNLCTKATAKAHGLDMDDTELRVDADIHGMTAVDMKGVYNEVEAVLKDFSNHIGHRNHKKDAKHLNKHASHLVRIYGMGIEILEEGEIRTYRAKDRELLLYIKDGGYQREDGSYDPAFFKMVDGLEKEFQKAAGKSTLPDMPDYKGILALSANMKECFLA